MAIDHQARKVLDQQGIEVVRAKYIKEIAVTNDPKRAIAFGDKKVSLGEVDEWLSRKARSNSCWTTVTGIAAVIAAIAAVVAVLIPLLMR